MAKLTLISASEPLEFQLQELNTVGRHPSSSIQILDRIISKIHLEIKRQLDETYLLTDLGSLNGTSIGDTPITVPQILSEGDEIHIGSATLVFTGANDAALGVPLTNVTLTPDDIQSHIQQRLEAEQAADFLPAREIQDVEILKRDYERLRLAHELSRAVGDELRVDQLLHKILDKAFEMLHADRGVIFLIDDAGTPVPRVSRHRDGNSLDEIVIPTSIVTEVLEKRQAVLSSDARIDSRFSAAKSIIIQGIRSTMCVPLIYGTELLGMVHLDSQIATNAFGEKDLQIFSSIAQQAAVAVQNARLVENIKREVGIRAKFQRFFSPAVVQQMVEGKLKLDGVGELREVTALFADIRGFTAMTERADAHAIVSMLNHYFDAMVEVLFCNKGTLDKYVGDEIMALFGVPINDDDAAFNAVNAALQMMDALEVFNEGRVLEGAQPIYIGIGINTGECVYGAIGSRKALQYTVIGDAVNIASRLCAAAKASEIILSQDTYEKIKTRINAERLPDIRVKGKAEPITIYRVIGLFT